MYILTYIGPHAVPQADRATPSTPPTPRHLPSQVKLPNKVGTWHLPSQVKLPNKPGKSGSNYTGNRKVTLRFSENGNKPKLEVLEKLGCRRATLKTRAAHVIPGFWEPKDTCTKRPDLQRVLP